MYIVELDFVGFWKLIILMGESSNEKVFCVYFKGIFFLRFERWEKVYGCVI